MEDENQQNNTSEGAPPMAPDGNERVRPSMETVVSDEEPPTRQVGASASTAPVAKTPRKKTTNFLGILIVTVLMAAALEAWWLFGPERATSQNTSLVATTEPAKLGIAPTVIDGSVLYQRDDAIWTTMNSNTQLAEGDLVRTSADGRVVLTLDDGSAVRLDADTMVKLTSLTTTNVTIEQMTGSVYSRVVPSDRTYAVMMGETTYEALGTAFVTVNTPGNSGVQVYQSSVKLSGLGEVVRQGKQYYRANTNAKLEGKVTDIDLDKLVSNPFITWNLAQDAEDSKFKDKLGVLSKVQQKVKEKAEAEKARQAEAAQKAEEEKAAEQKKAEQEAKDKTTQKVTRGTMNLSFNGETFSWSYTGKAIHGYKLVYSDRHEKPEFGRDASIYLSDQNTLTTAIPNVFKSYNSYYVRVCAYTAGTQDEPCLDYSNAVEVDDDHVKKFRLSF